MNPIFEHLTGMSVLTVWVVAMDLLIAAKSGVHNYVMAITETQDPEMKSTLTRHLEKAIDLHVQISDFMMKKGWYHPWNVQEQLQLDLQTMQTALKLPTL